MIGTDKICDIEHLPSHPATLTMGLTATLVVGCYREIRAAGSAPAGLRCAASVTLPLYAICIPACFRLFSCIA
jgi:hypothetical protein